VPKKNLSQQFSVEKATDENIGMAKTVGGKQVRKSTKDLYKRSTYHLTKEQIRGVKVIAFFEDKDISELMREIVQAYLDKSLSKYNTKL